MSYHPKTKTDKESNFLPALKRGVSSRFLCCRGSCVVFWVCHLRQHRIQITEVLFRRTKVERVHVFQIHPAPEPEPGPMEIFNKSSCGVEDGGVMVSRVCLGYEPATTAEMRMRRDDL